VHARFAGHTLLPEVRLFGADLGANFFTSSVHDATRSLELLRARITRKPSRYVGLCDRLLDHLYRLRDEQPWRLQAIAELGGAETMLHGDLWSTNTFVIPTEQGYATRLIDWDHAAVGPVSYDLSTFLLRFPRHSRTWIFDLYCAAMKQAGWKMPSWREFNLLSEIFEYARIANRIIWPSISLMKDKGEWAFEMLEEIEHWFDDLRPVLPQRFDMEKILTETPA
jgi:thiamine kinase-like enzyme